jgi:hypothetical protein
MFKSKAASPIMGGMTALPQKRMTVDQYLAWAEGQPGRYELLDGVVYAMSPEGAGHAEKRQLCMPPRSRPFGHEVSRAMHCPTE